MRNTVAAVILAAASLALGGCQLFSNSSMGGGLATAEQAPLDMSDYFAERVNTGKAHLLRNRPAQALVAFRQASYDAAHAGDAYNGMAIAYAQIGRADLARRYFELALAANPADERFARNLARLGTAADHAVAAQTLTNEVPSAPLAPGIPGGPQPSSPAADRNEAVEARMVRLSGSEVRVNVPVAASGTLTPGRELASAGGAAGFIAANGQSRSPVQAAGLKPRKSAYPLRIAMAGGPRRNYPVRIELPTSR